MSQNYPSIIAAIGSVAADGTPVWGAGAASAKSSTGVYTLTLDQGCDSTQCAIIITKRGAGTKCGFAVAQTSDTVKTVTSVSLVDGATVTDSEFDYVVYKAPLS